MRAARRCATTSVASRRRPTTFWTFRERCAQIGVGGPKAARERHVARGKLLPRERVRQLLDPGSLTPLAASPTVVRDTADGSALYVLMPMRV